MRMLYGRCPALIAGLLCGCASGAGESGLFGADSEAGTLGEDETGSAGANSDSSASEGSSEDDGAGDGLSGGVRFDVGALETGEAPSDGCSKVDFLFVVDNSGSMGDEQQNLVASFPEFISTIESVVASDFHVMVVSTGLNDYYEELFECYDDCQDPDEESCKVPGDGDTPCNALPPQPPACETDLGSGQLHSADLPPQECGVDGPGRFIRDDQSNLDSTFNCLALVGTDGDGSERPIEAMLTGTTAPMATAGGCNAGFLRDDAILVVTLITDEESEAPGTPAQWRTDLLAAKGDNETAVVVLGLIGDTDLPGSVCAPPDPLGGGGAEGSPLLREFVESFGTRGILGSVCEPTFAPFFESAVEAIDDACEEFKPEG